METAYLTGLKGARARKARARLIGAAREIALDRAPPAYAHVVDGWEAFSGYLYYEKLHEIGAALERAADGAEVEPSQAWQADIFRLYGFNGLAIGGDLAHLKRRLPAMAKGALRSVGIPFPENRARIVFGIAWRRLWIRARGERFVERPPDQRDTKALQRLDACQSVAGGLGFVLPVHGAYFQTRSLVWALEAGDPERMRG